MVEQSSFTRVQYKKGTRIIKQGREGGALYLIVEGSAAVVKDYKSDDAKTLAKIDSGAIFGEMSLLDGEPHAASVIALEDTELSMMAQDEFDRLYEEMNPIMQGIIQLLIDCLRQNL